MCTYFDSKVIVANMLQNQIYKKNGISLWDIDSYCQQIKKILNAQKEDVYFDVEQYDINELVYKYGDLYYKMLDKIYLRNEVNHEALDRFNYGYGDKVKAALLKAAAVN